MKYYSTRNKELQVSAEQAIVGNLCPLGGLYMPDHLPIFKDLTIFKNASLAEIGFIVAKEFFSEDFSESDLKQACDNAFNFTAPLVALSDQLTVLELTHGPSLAFKDFGARFLGEMLTLIAKKQGKHFQILVATSGDTGGAVAAALEGKQAVSVNILFPRGRISDFQKGQMTRFSGNVKTVEVEGSFDDCQRLVKEAFLNSVLNSREDIKLISANSINIARLVAQSIYYIYALSHREFNPTVTFVVPSGNLGNLTAGVFASAMTSCQAKFISAHNLNDTFPDFLQKGSYMPKTSIQTLSNAMDVGAPSNFERLYDYFEADLSRFNDSISACIVNDEQTLAAIQKYQLDYNYSACPHTAVALYASESAIGDKIVLSTASPLKFADVLKIAGINIENPLLEAEVAEATYRIKPELQTLLPLL